VLRGKGELLRGDGAGARDRAARKVLVRMNASTEVTRVHEDHKVECVFWKTKKVCWGGQESAQEKKGERKGKKN